MWPSTVPLRLWRPLCALGDAVLALGTLALAFTVRIGVPLPLTADLLPPARFDLAPAVIAVALFAQAVGLYFFGFYDPPGPRPDSELSRRLLPAVGLVAALFALWTVLSARPFPRSVLALWVVLDFLALWGWRAWLRRRLHLPLRRVALVGTGQPAHEIAALLAAHPWLGMAVVGHVPRPGEEAADGRSRVEPGAPAPGGDPSGDLGPRLGELDDLPGLLASGAVDDVILAASDDSWQTQLIDRLARLRPAHTNLLLVPGPFEALIGRARYRTVQDVPLIEVVRASEWTQRLPGKRLLDLAAGTLLLLLAAPLFVLVALLVAATSRGPVFYRQVRVGRGLAEFTLLKFRTMVDDAERDTGEVLASPNDPRLTPIGGFLRRYRLDELPQLLNVLAGEMSLVGPRPERPGFVQRYLAEVPGYAERFAVAPGVTGLAQIAGDYHSSPQNKLRYDLAYLANWSLWLDVSLLVQTVKIVLTSRGV
jgi:exopolysaccharide biosynthesis polyprenyl glycosylphosphotransferase